MTTNTETNDAVVEGLGLADNPDTAAVWAQLDAEEASGVVTTVSAPAEDHKDEPGAAAEAVKPGGDQPAGDKTGSTEPAAKEADSDPLSDLPKAVRDEIQGLRASNDALAARLRNAEGHIGGLRNELQRELQAAAAASAKAGVAAPTKDELSAAAKSPEALERLKEDYPQFADAMEAVYRHQSVELAAMRSEIKQAGAQGGDAKRIEQLEQRIVDLTISAHHKDWKAQVTQAGFDQWLSTQGREVRALAGSSDPEDIVRLLDIKAAQAKAKADAEQKTDTATARRHRAATAAAGIPAGRSTASIQTKDLDDMDPAELWAHLDKVEAAQAKRH